MNALCAMEAKHCSMSRCDKQTPVVQASKQALTWCPDYANRRRLTRSMPPANAASAIPNTIPNERAIASGDLSSLAHCPFLLGNPQDIDGRIADLLFRRAGFEPKVTARSDNVLTLLELCHYGMGACLCPERFLPALLDGERLRTLRVLDCGPDTAYAIQFGVPATSYRWSVIDDFIRCAREVTTGVSQ